MFVVGGESLIDLISKPIGPDGKRELVAKAGGSPMNCAIALSKLGNDTGFLCPISDRHLRRFLLEPLNGGGRHSCCSRTGCANPRRWRWSPTTAKATRAIAFYREADRAFTREGLIAALPAQLELFQIGGFCTDPRRRRRGLDGRRQGSSAPRRDDPDRPQCAAVADRRHGSPIGCGSRRRSTSPTSSRCRKRTCTIWMPKISLEAFAAHAAGQAQLRAGGDHAGRRRLARLQQAGECPQPDLSGQAWWRQCRRRRYADGRHAHLAQRPDGAGAGDLAQLDADQLEADAVVRRSSRRDQLQRAWVPIRRRAPKCCVPSSALLNPASPKIFAGLSAAPPLLCLPACGFVGWLIAVVVIIGAGIGIYMLTPVRGPARDLTLVGDVTRGNYLIRLGGCVTCHTDPKNKTALLAGAADRRSQDAVRYVLSAQHHLVENRRHRQLDAGAVRCGAERWRGTAGPSLSGVPL